LVESVNNSLVRFEPFTEGASSSGSLVCLQAGDASLDPVVFTYAIFGTVIGKEMMKSLGSRPIFSLQAPELTTDLRFTYMEDRALYHADDILSVLPSRHIHLVGFSAGGPLAIVLASIFETRNVRHHLTLIDPAPPVQQETVVFPNMTRRVFLAHLNSELGKAIISTDPIDNRHDDMRIFKALNCDEVVTGRVLHYLEVIEEISITSSRSFRRPIFATHGLKGEVSVFIMETGNAFFESLGIKSELMTTHKVGFSDGLYGWSPFFNQEPKKVVLSGGHFEWTDDLNLKVIAEHLMSN